MHRLMVLDPSSNNLFLQHLRSSEIAKRKPVLEAIGLQRFRLAESVKVVDVECLIVLETFHYHSVVWQIGIPTWHKSLSFFNLVNFINMVDNVTGVDELVVVTKSSLEWDLADIDDWAIKLNETMVVVHVAFDQIWPTLYLIHFKSDLITLFRNKAVNGSFFIFGANHIFGDAWIIDPVAGAFCNDLWRVDCQGLFWNCGFLLRLLWCQNILLRWLWAHVDGKWFSGQPPNLVALGFERFCQSIRLKRRWWKNTCLGAKFWANVSSFNLLAPQISKSLAESHFWSQQLAWCDHCLI